MDNKKKVNKKIALILILLLFTSYVFFAYEQVYYDEINLQTINMHIVVCVDIALELIKKIIDTLLNGDSLNIISISIVVIFIMYKFNLSELIENRLNDLISLEAGNFKLQFDKHVETIEKINKKEEENIKKLEEKKESDNTVNGNQKNIEEEIMFKKEKINLLNLIQEDKYIMQLLQKMMNKKKSTLKVPINIIIQNTSVENIGKVFKYSCKSNYVLITGFKNEVESLVNEIYLEIIAS